MVYRKCWGGIYNCYFCLILFWFRFLFEFLGGSVLCMVMFVGVGLEESLGIGLGVVEGITELVRGFFRRYLGWVLRIEYLLVNFLNVCYIRYLFLFVTWLLFFRDEEFVCGIGLE